MSTTSFSNTPQAKNDTFIFVEDSLLVQTGALYLDVMANDLGGKAKSLFSIDDGNGGSNNPTDLMIKDSLVNGVSAWEATAGGNLVRINNGKVEFNFSNSLASLGALNVNALAAGDVIQDTFVYAIQLGNGTLSWATATVTIQGQNDAASISGTSTGSIGEDDTTPITGQLSVIDPDHGQSHTIIASGATDHGIYSVDANGLWTFTLNNASVQNLNTGDLIYDSFIVSSLDGTAQQTVKVAINGADEVSVSTDIHVPGSPYGIKSADVNNDGFSDLIFTLVSQDTVGIMLGHGNGTFGALQTYATIGNPLGIAIADYNGDGVADLAVSGYLPGGPIQMLFGNGDGTFGGGYAFNSGADYAPRLAQGDFNGDGKADLVVSNNLSSGVSVLLGLGNGTFTAAGSYSSGTSATDVSLGDLNGDGKLDMAVSASFGNSVTIHLGNGDGTFSNSLTLPGAGTHGNAIADVNGDGKADLLAVNGNTNLLNVLLGNGDGTFQPQTGYSGGQSPYLLELGDMNGDGNVDAVTGNGLGAGISILFGDGNGGFGSEAQVAIGGAPSGLTLTDVNGDGRLDIAVSIQSTDTVTIKLNDWW